MVVILSEAQQNAFEKYEQGENVFITGPGGSGKTALIRYIVENAKEHGKVLNVCALTGTAAVLLQCNAKTVHSWAGIGLGNGDNLSVANKVNKSKYKKKNWVDVDILIIDEVSMMSLKLFELLNMTAKLCRKSVKLFGGIQVIFTGDFYQLPPVPTYNIPETAQFCFESPLWNKLFPNQLQLTKIFRQNDNAYKKILNQIRVGRITQSTLTILKGYVGRVRDINSTILPTILYPTRKKVEHINLQSLSTLSGKESSYDVSKCKIADITTLTKEQIEYGSTFSDEQKEYEYNYMMTNINFDNNLTLKIGAQVMCIVNKDLESSTPICNGSQGIIEKIDELDGLPIVRFNNGVVMKVAPHIWISEKIPTVAVKQIPLILAWAITIHKSQGASLDMAEIDIGEGIFECGQTYVALSRLNSIDGLYLKSFEPSRIIIHTKVRDFYDNLNKVKCP